MLSVSGAALTWSGGAGCIIEGVTLFKMHILMFSDMNLSPGLSVNPDQVHPSPLSLVS